MRGSQATSAGKLASAELSASQDGNYYIAGCVGLPALWTEKLLSQGQIGS